MKMIINMLKQLIQYNIRIDLVGLIIKILKGY